MANYSDLPEGYSVVNNPTPDSSVPQYSDIPAGYRPVTPGQPQSTSIADEVMPTVKAGLSRTYELASQVVQHPAAAGMAAAHGLTSFYAGMAGLGATGVAAAEKLTGLAPAGVDTEKIEPFEEGSKFAASLPTYPMTPEAEKIYNLAIGDAAKTAAQDVSEYAHKKALELSEKYPGSIVPATVGALIEQGANVLQYEAGIRAAKAGIAPFEKPTAFSAIPTITPANAKPAPREETPLAPAEVNPRQANVDAITNARDRFDPGTPAYKAIDSKLKTYQTGLDLENNIKAIDTQIGETDDPAVKQHLTEAKTQLQAKLAEHDNKHPIPTAAAPQAPAKALPALEYRPEPPPATTVTPEGIALTPEDQDRLEADRQTADMAQKAAATRAAKAAKAKPVEEPANLNKVIVKSDNTWPQGAGPVEGATEAPLGTEEQNARLEGLQQIPLNESTDVGPGTTPEEAREVASRSLGRKGVDNMVKEGSLVFTTSDKVPDQHKEFVKNNPGTNAFYEPSDRGGLGVGYVLADRTPTEGVVKAIYHEIGEHHNLEAMMEADKPGSYQKLKDDVLKQADADPNSIVGKIARALNDRPNTLSGGPNPYYKLRDTDPGQFAKELLAHVGQRYPNNPLIRRIRGAINGFLYKRGFGTINSDGIAYLVNRSLQREMKSPKTIPATQEGLPQTGPLSSANFVDYRTMNADRLQRLHQDMVRREQEAPEGSVTKINLGFERTLMEQAMRDRRIEQLNAGQIGNEQGLGVSAKDRLRLGKTVNLTDSPEALAERQANRDFFAKRTPAQLEGDLDRIADKHSTESDPFERARLEAQHKDASEALAAKTEPPKKPLSSAKVLSDEEERKPSLLEKAGIEKEPKPELTTQAALDKVRQAKEETAQGMFDVYRGVKAADLAKGINIGSKESAYAGLRNAAASNKVAHEWIASGQFQMREGIPQAIPGKKGLMDILDPIKGDAKDFFAWMRGKRAEYLKSQGKEHLFNKQEIEDLKAHGAGKEAQFEAVAAQMRDWHNNLLHFLADTGLLNRGSIAKLSQDKYYIPRLEAKEKNEGVEPIYKAVKNWNAAGWQDSGVKTLTGGTHGLRDPLRDISENLYNAVDAGMKNEAIQRAAKAHPDLMPLAPEGERTQPDVQRVMNNGVAAYHHVLDGPLLQGLQGPPVVPKSLTTVLKPFKAAANLVRSTVTVAPTFMFRTYAKHAEYGWVFSKDGYRPVHDTIEGLKRALDSPELSMLKGAGAAFGGTERFGGSPESAADALRRELVTKGWETSLMDKLQTGPQWFRAYRALQDAAENANRISQVIQAKRAGLSPSEQVYQARDLQDYNLKGSSIAVRILGDTVPFLSPKLFSIYKLGGSLNSARFFSIAAKIGVASTLLHAVNSSNEKYKSLTDQEKDLAWHVFVGDHHFRIPKPFEIGSILSSVPEKLYDGLTGNDTNMAQALQHVLRLVGGEFSMELPALIKPAYEVMANKKGTTGMPIETQGDLNKEPAYRYNEEYTPVTLRDIGKAFNVSPKVLEHLVNGYFGTAGSAALAVSDYLDWKAKGISRPTLTTDDIPILNIFYRSNNPDTRQYGADLYDLLQKADRTSQTFNALVNSGNATEARGLAKEQGDLMKARPALEARAQVEKELKQQIDATLRNPLMSADEKKAKIDLLKQREYDILKSSRPLVGALKKAGY